MRRIPLYVICRGEVVPGSPQWDVYLERYSHMSLPQPTRVTVYLRTGLTDEQARAFYEGLRANTALRYDDHNTYSYFDLP